MSLCKWATKSAISCVFVLATLLISVANGDLLARTTPARGDETTFTITMDSTNAPTTSETYVYAESDIRHSHFAYSAAKVNPGHHVELNADGYIKNTINSRITSILSVTAVFTTTGSLSLDTVYYGFDQFADPVSLTSGSAYDLSASLPYFLKLTANDAPVTITSVAIVYSCVPHEDPLNDGDYYYLGSYPQTQVTDGTLISTLNSTGGPLPSADNSQAWTSYGFYISNSNATNFMWYQDVVNGQDRYRGVHFTSYRPYLTSVSSSIYESYQDENGYSVNTSYWFKYEPIRWDVLSVDETEGPLVVADMVLDSRDYYHSDSNRTIESRTIYANNYKESDIRNWLNNDFYDQAFSSAEQSVIKTTTVDNSVASTGDASNDWACENTNDQVFLLSSLEATNSSYGFTSDASRIRQATDYAKAMGVRVMSNNAYWWTRSPYYNNYFSAYIFNQDGVIKYYLTRYTMNGVLPAFRINL